MAPRRPKPGASPFADRLNLLFDRARARGEPLTNEDVERLTKGVISANHVWRLRNGRNQNPGLETLGALADVFGVALDYFAGRDEAGDEAAIRRALAQPEFRGLVARLGTAHVNQRDAARLAAIVQAFLAEDPRIWGSSVTVLDLDTMRRVQRRMDTEFTDLIDWRAFSLGAVQSAVAARVGGEIVLAPLHWEAWAYFGLAVGYRSPAGPRWLIVYEQEAVAEHHLMIVLHELVHIALGHCGARLTSDELRRELVRLGLIGPSVEALTYARVCLPPGDQDAGSDADHEEAEAELGAAWIVTRARGAGGLPPSGQVFSAEHLALRRFLGDTEGR